MRDAMYSADLTGDEAMAAKRLDCMIKKSWVTKEIFNVLRESGLQRSQQIEVIEAVLQSTYANEWR